MLLNTELNLHFKSRYFAYGIFCVLPFTTSIWNNLLGKFNTFKLQNRVVSVMSGVGPKSSCTSLCRKLNILPVACLCILSLMLIIADNQKDFVTNAYVHNLDNRNKNHLYLPIVSLSCVQKGVSYSGEKNL